MNIRTDLHSGSACYTVQQGDSLSSIAQQFYGSASPQNVTRVYLSNLQTIGTNPNLIVPGQQLYIPS
jgi:resuscitation-promoting factor RpfA